jgi:hypothetical protein
LASGAHARTVFTRSAFCAAFFTIVYIDKNGGKNDQKAKNAQKSSVDDDVAKPLQSITKTIHKSCGQAIINNEFIAMVNPSNGTFGKFQQFQ